MSEQVKTGEIIEIDLDLLRLDLARMGWNVDETMAIVYAVKNAPERIKAIEKAYKTLNVRIDEASE